jgi:hypothetical protein
LARHCRGPFDKARPPCGGFNVFCGKECCEHSKRAEHMFSQRSLLRTVLGREPHSILTRSGDFFLPWKFNRLFR